VVGLRRIVQSCASCPPRAVSACGRAQQSGEDAVTRGRETDPAPSAPKAAGPCKHTYPLSLLGWTREGTYWAVNLPVRAPRRDQSWVNFCLLQRVEDRRGLVSALTQAGESTIQMSYARTDLRLGCSSFHLQALMPQATDRKHCFQALHTRTSREDLYILPVRPVSDSAPLGGPTSKRVAGQCPLGRRAPRAARTADRSPSMRPSLAAKGRFRAPSTQNMRRTAPPAPKGLRVPSSRAEAGINSRMRVRRS
jgi:hypothetical protein